MIEIPLTQGKVALIDDEDWHLVDIGYSWRVQKSDRNYYAVTTVPKENGKGRTTLRMHRLIVGVQEDIDHINHNGLDCRRSNLRIVNDTQNCMNQRPQLEAVSSTREFLGTKIAVNGDPEYK